jgi:hypothetical protein
MHVTVSGVQRNFIIGDAVLIELLQKLKIVEYGLFPVMVAMDEFVIVVFILIAQFVKIELQHFVFLKINHREGQYILCFSFYRVKKDSPDILIEHMVLKILILRLNPS